MIKMEEIFNMIIDEGLVRKLELEIDVYLKKEIQSGHSYNKNKRDDK